MSNEKKRLFVVGTAKSGTTSLYNYLFQHPDIFLPNVKEIHYYSNAISKRKRDFIIPKENKQYHTKVIKDRKNYEALFKKAKDEIYLADCSPSYFYDSNAATKIYKDFPDAKIIVILREPMDRAYSQFLMERRIGIESQESFLEALRSDFENGKHRIWGEDHLYVDHGFYFTQLQYYKRYFEENQILCVSFQDFIKYPHKTLEQILMFLNLDPKFNFHLEKVHNQHKTYRNTLTKFIVNHKEGLLMLEDIFPNWIIDFVKTVLFKKTPKPQMDPKAVLYLKKIYMDEFVQLKEESLIHAEFYEYLTHKIFS